MNRSCCFLLFFSVILFWHVSLSAMFWRGNICADTNHFQGGHEAHRLIVPSSNPGNMTSFYNFNRLQEPDFLGKLLVAAVKDVSRLFRFCLPRRVQHN